MTRARIMYNMTVREVREGLRETQTVLLPLGVVEQHGYHLLLSTDIHNAQEIAARASVETGCFVAPCVHYSFSGGTLPGTINITPQVFSLVVMDILRSLLAQGFRHVVILLGHGGPENVVAANDAALMFQRLRPPRRPASPFRSSPSGSSRPPTAVPLRRATFTPGATRPR